MNLNKAGISPLFRSVALVGLVVVYIMSLVMLVFAVVYIYASDLNPIALGITFTLAILFGLLFTRIHYYFVFFWTAKGIYDVTLFPYRYLLGNLYFCFGQPDVRGEENYFVPIFVGPENLRKDEKNQELLSSGFSRIYHKKEIFKILTELLKVRFPDIVSRDYYVCWDLTSAIYVGGGTSGFLLVHSPLSESGRIEKRDRDFDRLAPPPDIAS